jgi:hypothetical protein
MACSNTILIVDNNVVCNNYLQQQAARVLAEVDHELNSFMLFKQQLASDVINTKNRVDNKFVKAYS